MFDDGFEGSCRRPRFYRRQPSPATGASESRAKEHKVQNWFRENNVKEKSGVNYIGEDSASDNDTDVCVAEWVVTSREKPLACSFLKPSPGRRDEMKFTFDVTKCDKLLDLCFA
jgi:hypothetical protein